MHVPRSFGKLAFLSCLTALTPCQSNVIYTGSEDGILCGWQMPPSDSLTTGDSSRESTEEADMSDGSQDGRDEQEDENDGMNVDEDDEEDMVFAGRADAVENGKRRAAEVWGGGSGKRRRE